MPSEIKLRSGFASRFFTIRELREMGIKGDAYYEDWGWDETTNTFNGIIKGTEISTNSHGPAVLVTFKYEERFWQISVGFYHEDWSTNDLNEYEGDSRMEAYEVEPYTVTRYQKKRVPQQD